MEGFLHHLVFPNYSVLWVGQKTVIRLELHPVAHIYARRMIDLKYFVGKIKTFKLAGKNCKYNVPLYYNNYCCSCKKQPFFCLFRFRAIDQSIQRFIFRKNIFNFQIKSSIFLLIATIINNNYWRKWFATYISFDRTTKVMWIGFNYSILHTIQKFH